MTYKNMILEDVEEMMNKVAGFLFDSYKIHLDEPENVLRLVDFAMATSNTPVRIIMELEKKWRLLLEHMPDMVLSLDSDGKIVFINKAPAGTSFKEIVGTRVYDFVLFEAPHIKGRLRKALHQNEPTAFEISHPNQSWHMVRCIPIESYAESLGYTIIVTDITDYKKAKERADESLREKDVLLREINHRVKNNLQVMSSLLKLQFQNNPDVRILEMLRESQNRIRSMALVHEELNRSNELKKINFADYIRILSNELYQMYGVDFNRIVLDVRVEDIYLGIDIAIHCGLIINELISNALKYAFPTDWQYQGKIKILLHKTKGNDVRLIIADDGIGMPVTIDYRQTSSLGLSLVRMLVKDQLKGRVRLDKKNGTRFSIKFNPILK